MPPLTGIRVLDLTTVVAGPTATMILCDLGADVIKVERVDGGDDSRGLGPLKEGWGAYFVPLNRGKRSIAINIAKPEGRDAVLRIARTCDVFLESLRGGKIEALGLGEDAVRAVSPAIIYGALTGYGPAGPDFSKPAYDALIQGRTGIVSVTGTSEQPVRAGISVIDNPAGMWLAMAVLAALFERQKTGKGQRVETSLFETGVSAMAYHLVYRQFTGESPRRQGAAHLAFGPYGAYEAADGPVMIGISNDRQFQRLAQILDRPGWSADPRYRTNVLRVENRPALDPELSAIFKTKPRAHWVALLESVDVPVCLIQDTTEILADPQLAAIGQMIPVALTPSDTVKVPRIPFRLSGSDDAQPNTLPSLSEHAREILTESGFSREEIERLRADGTCLLR